MEAVFVGDILGPEGLHLLFQIVLRLQHHAYVSLQEIELTLQVKPATHDQRSQ